MADAAAPAAVVPVTELTSFERQWVQIQQAERRLRSRLPPTPMIRAKRIAGKFGSVYYKCEHVRWTGSFKERGALNALLQLTPEQRKLGVVAASAGNHALALAHWGQQLDIPVYVVMPLTAPVTKVANCKLFGAHVEQHGSNISEARVVADRLASEKGLQYINGFNDHAIIAGAGVCGLELLEQCPDVEVVLVPAGGGGLLSGVALAVKMANPHVRIIGIESEACPSILLGLQQGKPTTVPTVRATIADGLAVPTAGDNALPIISKFVDEVITIPERCFSVGILHLLENEKMVLEGGGACGVAGLLSGKLDSIKDKKIVCLLTGGNIDTTVLGKVLEMGMFQQGRLAQFEVAISDRPGGAARFLSTLAATGVSVKDILQQRPFISDVNLTALHITIEARDREHLEKAFAFIASKGFTALRSTGTQWETVDHTSLVSKL